MIRSIVKALGLLAGLAGGLHAAPYTVQAQVDRPVLDARGDRRVVLRVNLEGLQHQLRERRPPLNLTLVIDRSGSMAGEKLENAKAAARSIIGRLGSEDVFSLVSFDDQVKVELPAQYLRNPAAALRAINNLEPGGSTALYAGVKAGLAQAREFAKRGRTSRLILLSDGLANVGPDKPRDARELGRDAARHGIAVSTFGLGLGYDEDLLTALSQASDGNHAFIRDAGDIARILDRELGDALAVAARDIVIEIRLADGVRYRRCLDREIEVNGNTLRLRLNQLASGQEKQLLVEVEAPEAAVGANQSLASVEVNGADAEGQAAPAARQDLAVRYTDDAKDADRSRNADVVAETVKAQANEAREMAVQLRDAGKKEEAQQVLNQSVDSIRAFNSSALGAAAPAAPALKSMGDDLQKESDYVGSDGDWNEGRKDMKAKAFSTRNGQSY
jgi:Ca-activated chloride channel family protein